MKNVVPSKIKMKLSSIFCWNPKSYKRSASPDELDEFRERGRLLLRQMLESDDTDLNDVVRAARELHEEEQEWLGKQSHKDRAKYEKALLQRRKQNDKVGSFSANMLTYRKQDACDDGTDRSQSKRDAGSLSSSTASFCPLDDFSSLASSAAHRRHDDAMSVIEEESEFPIEFPVEWELSG